MGLADLRTVKSLVTITLPLGIAGAIVAHHAPVQLLRIGYGAAMLGVAWLLHKGNSGRRVREKCPCLVRESERSHQDCPPTQRREIRAADGKTYDYCPERLNQQRVLSGIGAFTAGLMSTGVGEPTLPTLVRRSKFPVPVAAATSTLVVAGIVVGAATTHLVQLGLGGGLSAIPWNLIVWAVPGAFIGAIIGSHLQGRVGERATRIFFSLLFLAIGLTFLLVFTVFGSRFEVG